MKNSKYLLKYLKFFKFSDIDIQKKPFTIPKQNRQHILLKISEIRQFSAFGFFFFFK